MWKYQQKLANIYKIVNMKQMKLAKISAFMLIILVGIYFNWKVLCTFMPLVNYSISISISLFSNKLIYIFSALYSEDIGRCKDWISYISRASNIFWYTWNLNFRNDSRNSQWSLIFQLCVRYFGKLKYYTLEEETTSPIFSCHVCIWKTVS